MDPATIIQLADACIGIVKAIAEIGSAARDAHGMPASLQAIFEQLPVLEELLNAARNHGQQEDLANNEQQSVKPILSSCQQALSEMRDLFKEACPKDESDRTQRVWRGMKFYFFGKNSKLQKLLVTVLDNLKLLGMKKVFVIGDKLDKLQTLTEELGPEDTGSQHNTTDSGNIFGQSGSGRFEQKNEVSSGKHAKHISTTTYNDNCT
jgi:hypothetical protein